MKIKILPLLGWTLLYFIYKDIISGIIQYRDIGNFLTDFFSSNHGLALETSSMITKFLGAICSYLILYYTIPQKKYFATILSFILLFISLSAIRYTLDEILFLEIFGKGNYYGDFSAFYYIIDNSYFTSGFALIGCAFFFFQYSILNEKKNHELVIENKKTELSFLKSQINPHFLFNSLNNLYSLVYQQSEKALPFVSKLSNLIRYSLYEGDDKIPMSKELNYIKDYIELERMRYPYPLSLELNIEEELENIKIPPYIFIPFIENAFKHGSLEDQENPLTISVIKRGKDILFNCTNKIKPKEKDKVGGIGLQNVKKRLELIYENQHELNISSEDELFQVNLKLNNLC